MTKKTAPKKTATKPAESTPKTYDPGSIGEARPTFFTYMKDERNTAEPTLYTYGKDFDIIEGFFKPEKVLTKLMPANVGSFLKCDGLLKKPNGQARAQRTIDKTARVLRMFLTWTVETKRLEKAPIPREARLGGKSIAQQEQALKDRERKAEELKTKAKQERALAKEAKLKAKAEKAQAEAAKSETANTTKEEAAKK
jgi:hypothetical protein